MSVTSVKCIYQGPYLNSVGPDGRPIDGPQEFHGVILGKVYSVLAVEEGWYRIVDESGEDYLYPPWMFEVV